MSSCVQQTNQNTTAEKFDASLINGLYKIHYDHSSIDEYVKEKANGSGLQEIKYKGHAALLKTSNIDYIFIGEGTVVQKGSTMTGQMNDTAKWKIEGCI